MRFFRRSLFSLGIAASLPTIVFAAVGVFIFLRTSGHRVESETLARAQTVMALVDSQLRGDAAALNVLSSSVYFDTKNWAEFYGRVARIRDGNPHWQTIVLYDVNARQELFDLRRPMSPPRPSSVFGLRELQRLERTAKPFVGNVVSESPRPLFYIYVPVVQGGTVSYVFAVGVTTETFQDIVAEQAIGNSVAALVDQSGVFVARSLDAERRVGQPATQFVRDAIRDNTQGLYRGKTYEGLDNYTAFHLSPWSGWSVHIAIASSLIDTPTSWSFVVAVAAALGAALLGAVLITLVLRDMAERRRAEDALRQSQKMEAVGQLTGGIAHDFNNLLTAIIGNLDLIRTRSRGNDRVERLAENALEAAQRGAKLSSQLLAFSRNQRMELAPVSIAQLLNGMSDLFAQSLGPSVAIRTHIATDAMVISSDANQLELALLNLAVNARDAMPNGGTLEIATAPAAPEHVRDLPDGRYVELRITDNGRGMQEEVRTRAMDPFFTTKPVGQGTGLGLSQVYGVVRESGGMVFIESAPDAGTTIRMIFPAADLDVPATVVPTAALRIPTPPVPAHVSLLVVDDDRQVRRFIADSLRSLGYSVTDVPNADVGLSILRTTRFNLLIADFAMPGMNGAELAREAQLLQPDLRVLMVSGYADSATLDKLLGNVHMLRKPFAIAELGTAVAEALGADTTTAS